MNKISLSPHAIKRMKKRGITLSQIEKVIKNPAKTINQTNGKIKVIGELSNSKKLAVVYIKTRFEIIIITTHKIKI